MNVEAGLVAGFMVLNVMLVAYLWLRCRLLARQVERLKLARERLPYRWKNGFSRGRGGAYNLFSLDRGEHWYRVEDGRIVGEADPELLAHVEAWEDIYDAARDGKALDADALRQAGFEVRVKGADDAAGL